MKKELSHYIIRMILALIIIIGLGIAGEWDYQTHSQNQPEVTIY